MTAVNLIRLQDVLSYRFTRVPLLQLALTHRSFGKDNNERLEFLGDGALNFVIAHLLYERFPAACEGQLSRLRAHLVCESALADLARRCGLGSYLHLGPGELKSGGARRDSILAGALEAIIGAVYLDGGLTAVETLMSNLYRDAWATLSLEQGFKDPKTQLQEYLQSHGWALPEYRITVTEGDAHKQRFQVECALPSLGVVTHGYGTSRRRAEQAAADLALRQLVGKSAAGSHERL